MHDERIRDLAPRVANATTLRIRDLHFAIVRPPGLAQNQTGGQGTVTLLSVIRNVHQGSASRGLHPVYLTEQRDNGRHLRQRPTTVEGQSNTREQLYTQGHCQPKDQAKLMKYKLSSLAVATALISTQAMATNGYAPHGIGMTSKGMGGVFIGYQPDSVALGGNPAGSAFMDTRLDVGLDMFRPDRSAAINGNANVPDSTYDGNDSDLFFIPEFGYRRAANDQYAYGLSVFGNGGMNTDYRTGIPLLNGGTTETTGIDLVQLFVVPNVSIKINPQHAFGLGLNLAAQGFKAEGLRSFDNAEFSSSPGKVTNNGTDWAFGAGLRLGWIGKLDEQWQVGATYQTRTAMTEFDKYAGLFAEQGDFDIPSNFGLGFAFTPTGKLTIAADVMRINFSEVDSVGNSGQAQAQLGADNGPGFGWEDSTVLKLGIEYTLNQTWTLRAGYNHGDGPVPQSQTLFNILAPGVVEDHLTLGSTWKATPSMAVTATYMHAFEETVSGRDSIPAGAPFGGGEADVTMSQNSLGLALAWQY